MTVTLTQRTIDIIEGICDPIASLSLGERTCDASIILPWYRKQSLLTMSPSWPATVNFYHLHYQTNNQTIQLVLEGSFFLSSSLTLSPRIDQRKRPRSSLREKGDWGKMSQCMMRDVKADTVSFDARVCGWSPHRAKGESIWAREYSE